MKRLIIIAIVIVLCTAVAFGQPSELMGYWEIPDLGTISPLYRQDLDLRNSQQIVDRANSALYADYGIGHMICDHANSFVGGGNWNINQVKLDSRAYLVLPDRTEEYVCYLVCRADYGELSYTIGRKSILPICETDIACVCCATADASEVYIAMFRLKG